MGHPIFRQSVGANKVAEPSQWSMGILGSWTLHRRQPSQTGGGVALQIQLWGILAPLGEWLFLRIVGKVRQWLVEFYFG